MILALEYRKLKRTGYRPAFLTGGLLAAAIPLLQTAARLEVFRNLPDDPLTILLNANWNMMAMLNLMLVLCGACIMYHTEYADHALQKMELLPVSPFRLFAGKCVLTALAVSGCLVLEAAALALCCRLWFSASFVDLVRLAQEMACSLVLTLPTIVFMLVVASLCRNMWVSLGIGLILLFIVMTLPDDSLLCSLLPFAAPLRLLSQLQRDGFARELLTGCAAETILLLASETILLKLRRCFS